MQRRMLPVLLALSFAACIHIRDPYDPRLMEAREVAAQAEQYRRAGQYAQAASLLEYALELQEEALGPDDLDITGTLNDLALLYIDQEAYRLAEPLLNRALAIRERRLGSTHPRVAHVLVNLGALYLGQGDLVRAKETSERAITIVERVLGRNDFRLATPLVTLASIHQNEEDDPQAEQLLVRALGVLEAHYGRAHPELITPLNNLAAVYNIDGRFALAQKVLERALAIAKRDPNTSPLDVAVLLHTLGLSYMQQGDLERAQMLLERALRTREQILPPDHPRIAVSHQALAALHLLQQDLSLALSELERSLATNETQLSKEVANSSEQRLASALDDCWANDQIVYTVARHHSQVERVQQVALTASLLHKGRFVEELAHRSRLINHSLDDASRRSLEDLRAKRNELAALITRGPGTLSAADYQRRLEKLSGEIGVMEAERISRSQQSRSESRMPLPSEITQTLAAALPRDGVLIDFVRYCDSPLVPEPGTAPTQIPSTPRYLALLLFSDGHSGVADLGPAGAIDRAVKTLLQDLSSDGRAYESSTQALYTLVFRPVAASLGDVRRLFIAPGGQLTLIPFAALHDGKRFLVDTFDIHYVLSGNDLLARRDDVTTRHSVIVLADPDFSSPLSASSEARDAAPPLQCSAPSKPTPARLVDGGDSPWPPLPCTKQEAEAIHRLIPEARVLLGRAASKQALMELGTPGILHIATHGFFRKELSALVAKYVPRLGDVGPLLRSGLVLASSRASSPQAGSNHRADSEVTALELSGLNLWGTQLVVLSACETGRGEVKDDGQGVYGLRSALMAAGTETLVTSLWAVNDETTQELMEAYYRQLLAGQGRISALRQAMQIMRRKRPHPYFWAPFIAIGQDTPLEGVALRANEDQ